MSRLQNVERVPAANNQSISFESHCDDEFQSEDDIDGLHINANGREVVGNQPKGSTYLK